MDKVRYLTQIIKHLKFIFIKIDRLNVTAYSYATTKQEKLLKQARNNPNGLSFDDFKTLLKRHKWIEDHQTGNHSIWYSPRKSRLSIQNRNGMAKGYQVNQFLALIDEETKDV